MDVDEQRPYNESNDNQCSGVTCLRSKNSMTLTSNAPTMKQKGRWRATPYDDTIMTYTRYGHTMTQMNMRKLFGLLALISGTAFAKCHYIKREVMIPMRDSVQLYTAIYVPKNAQNAPLILQRTPYSCKPYGDEISDQFNRDYWKDYAMRGYIIVFQDVRGRYQSEGTFIHLNPNEINDTYDTADWLINNVPECNGNIGVVGNSYGGFYAFMAGCTGHKAIKIVSPQAPVTDWWQGDDMHHNGAFCPTAGGFLDYMQYGEADETPNDETLSEAEYQTQYDEYLAYRTIANLTKHLNEKRPNDFWNEMVSHPEYDLWWQERDARRYVSHLSVQAVLVTGGLFDGEDYFGAIKLYEAISQQRQDIDCRRVIGPWTHGGWRKYTKTLGDWRFAWVRSPSKDYMRNIEIPMMEQYLRSKSSLSGKSSTNSVNMPIGKNTDRWFITGSNRWTTAPLRQPSLQLFLHADGGLSAFPPSEGSTTYISDPNNPVPSNEARNDGKDYMYADQRFLQGRDDVVSFQTVPLAHDMTMRGKAIMHLSVSLTTEDADFFVKIIDVLPDGRQLMVRSEMMRGKYRNVAPQPFSLSEPNDFDIVLLPLSHTFRRGHRIMIQIQSSAFPLFDRNPQSFVDIYQCDEAAFQSSTITLHHNSQDACYVLLPMDK